MRIYDKFIPVTNDQAMRFLEEVVRDQIGGKYLPTGRIVKTVPLLIAPPIGGMLN